MLKFVTAAKTNRLYTCIIMLELQHVRNFSRISSRYRRPKDNLVSSVSTDPKLTHTPTMNDEDVIMKTLNEIKKMILNNNSSSQLKTLS
jgi:hypothetical protein